MFDHVLSSLMTDNIMTIGLVLFSWALALTYPRSSWFRHWAFGNTALVAGLFLILLQGSVSSWVSIILANALLYGAVLLLARGLENFADRKSRPKFFPIAYGAAVLSLAFFTFVWDLFPVRSLILGSVMLLSCLTILRVLWTGLHEEWVSTPSLIIGLSATFILLTVAPFVAAGLAFAQGTTSIWGANNFRVVAHLTVVLAMMIWTTGFFSLVLAREHNRLQRSLATRDRMMALIAHDLRGPVGNVATMLDMVNDPMLDADDRTALITASTQTAWESVQLMETLLDWALAKEVNVAITPETLDPEDLIKTSLAPLASIAQNKGITLISEAARSKGVMVRADRRTTTTVIRNLVSNALKFTPSEGSVTISTELRGNLIGLSVADTGPGLPAGLVQKLNKGYSIPSTNGTAGEKGTGLGLQLCRDFAHVNGGLLEFASSEKGTKATLFLPPVTT
jgi:signal transduction histidine kinase